MATERLKVILSHFPNISNIPILNQKLQDIPPNIELLPPPVGLEEAFQVLFTKDCLNFLKELMEKFEEQIDQVLQLRVTRRCAIIAGKPPSFKTSDEVSDSNWKVDAIPQRLLNRKLDLGDISPSRTDLLIGAMNSPVQGIQVDFDDGHCPSWRNQLQGLYNVYLAVHNHLPGAQALHQAPVLMLRPRAWNMVEHNIMINGREVAGPLIDFGVLMFHNARLMAQQHAGPYFYLSKVESTEEARLWDGIFTWSEKHLDLGFGAIKSCVLIENILATFEMESILYQLRHHCIGLNCGIWDYSASIISLFGRRPEFVISDRTRYVTIDQMFLSSYIQLLIQVCHRHGALATGGMAALVLPDSKDSNIDDVVARVCGGKLKEIRMGLDGFMVHDLGLVPHVNEMWNQHCKGENQLALQLPEFKPSPADLLRVPVGNVSRGALEHNIAVATLFIDAWLRESGTFVYRGSVEDSATAEISRSQVWQWIYHQVLLEDTGERVTRRLVFELVDKFAGHSATQDVAKMSLAVALFKELVTTRDPPIFITTYLNNHSLFRAVQK